MPTQRFFRLKTLGLGLTCALPMLLLASSTYEPATLGAGNAGSGKHVYQRYCIQCHGQFGDGNGESANWTVPRPRDYRQGLFKFRSTPYGSLPLVSDLYHTITYGLYGTSMPPFGSIEPRARLDVIAYIMTFSPRWQNEPRPTPIEIPSETPATTESAIRGKEIFAHNCASCHGDGTGNGPLAKKTIDAWGNALPPANLTRGRTKQEVTAHDIYRTFMTGLNGTPMAGFANKLTSDQAWDVVHYVESLGPWKESNKALQLAASQNYMTAPGGGPMNASVAGGTAVAATGTTTKIALAGTISTDPPEIDIHPGDAVTFTNDGGGPHSIAFYADSIPAGAGIQLQANMPNTSGPLIGPVFSSEGDSYTVSFANMPKGTYIFYCLPHLGVGERGKIVVQ
jgi:mono/diheme cytochrome c family protein